MTYNPHNCNWATRLLKNAIRIIFIYITIDFVFITLCIKYSDERYLWSNWRRNSWFYFKKKNKEWFSSIYIILLLYLKCIELICNIKFIVLLNIICLRHTQKFRMPCILPQLTYKEANCYFLSFPLPEYFVLQIKSKVKH